MSSCDRPWSVVPNDWSHVMLYFSSVAEHILCFRNYSTIFLTIISHRNDFGTQVQWHFLSDGGEREVIPGSKMSRDHERQVVPCEPPGKEQKTSLGKTDKDKWNTVPRDPRKKAQECGCRIGGIGAGVRHEVTHFVFREISTSPIPCMPSRLEACTKSLPQMRQVVLIYWIQI